MRLKESTVLIEGDVDDVFDRVDDDDKIVSVNVQCPAELFSIYLCWA